MMRFLLLFLWIALLVAAAVWLADHPARVTIDDITVFGEKWRIDTSLGILVLAVAVLSTVAAIVSRFWGAVRSAPGQFLSARRTSRRQRGYKALSQGMVAVAAGDASEARRWARKADVLLDDPPLTMLLSAQAAQLGGEEAAARRYFESMLNHTDTAFLGVRGLLMQAIKAGDKIEALRLAERAYKLRPTTGWVVDQLFELQVEAGLWGEANQTVRAAIRQKAMRAPDARRRRAAVLLEHSRSAEAEGGEDAAMSRAREAHDLDPTLIPATVTLARLHKARGRAARGAKLIEEAWARQPNPELAAAYGEALEETDSLARVKRFQRLFSFRPDHPESHVALAGAALEAELWGEARKHLADAAGGAPTARICRMMAELEESEHGNTSAAREWLARATTAAADEAWVCKDCGAVAGAWSGLCGNCSAFDTLAWQAPPRAARIAPAEKAPAPALPAKPAQKNVPKPA